MRNIKLLLSYDGTDFFGWQRQPNHRTVQQVVEEALGALTGVTPSMNASGRTDAGVHALGQVAHFYTASRHPCEVIVKALNATLPVDVRILGAWDMPQSFHATLDAKSKMYRYVIDNGRVADPFKRRYSYHVYKALDVEAMQRASRALLGRHDFRSFETNWPNRTSSVRTIMSLEVLRQGDAVWIEVEADGFLYNMVRSIAGTLVQVGMKRRPEEWVREALVAEDRREAGPTAPPEGLFMVVVRYSDSQPLDFKP
ncbi:tRNA pseudouridine(38-40) synthase TruA [Singulisphaera sp. PoT]|uniref:tRNA pseudouridine(38-40) synthase TruA n=1 Tax=Singulisphaera sp. PoT TaxID=3411797 RepID=UPI003BF5E229